MILDDCQIIAFLDDIVYCGIIFSIMSKKVVSDYLQSKRVVDFPDLSPSRAELVVSVPKVPFYGYESF